MLSKRFFSAEPSCSGQSDSSWWQKMTFSRIACSNTMCEAPHCCHLCASNHSKRASPHLGHAQHVGHNRVNLRALLAQASDRAIRGCCLEHTIQRLELQLGPLLCQLQTANRRDSPPCAVAEQEPDLGLYFGSTRHLRAAYGQMQPALCNCIGPRTLGSWTNSWPALELGGREPQEAYLSASMMVCCTPVQCGEGWRGR